MSLGNIHGFLESGFVDFAGETKKTVTLEKAERSPKFAINLVVNETQDVNAASTASNKEKDIPVRNLGNIQIAAAFTGGKTFDITTSAEFYGRVNWFIIDMKG